MIVKEDIEKALKESFDVAKVTNVIFDEIQKAFTKGFDLGVKAVSDAGRVKWHDLRKNPKDLPTCDCETITLHENGNKNIQRWQNGNWTNAIVIPIVAWCEILEFNEK